MMSIFLHKISFRFRKVRIFLKTFPNQLIDYLFLRFYGVKTEFGYVKLYGFPIISKCKGSTIIIGKGCSLISKSKYNLAGINHPVILATLSAGAIIEIGKVGISGSSICAVKSITIGDNSGLGANSNIFDSDFHSIDGNKRLNQTDILDAAFSEVKIGKNVWIASNVTILKGVTIGDEAVIGACSVVTSSVPAKTVYAGNPARKIKDL